MIYSIDRDGGDLEELGNAVDISWVFVKGGHINGGGEYRDDFLLEIARVLKLRISTVDDMEGFHLKGGVSDQIHALMGARMMSNHHYEILLLMHVYL